MKITINWSSIKFGVAHPRASCWLWTCGLPDRFSLIRSHGACWAPHTVGIKPSLVIFWRQKDADEGDSHWSKWFIDVYSTYACPPNNKHRPSRPVTIESVQQKGSPGQSDSSWQGLMIQVFNSGAQRLCRSVICFLLNFPAVGPAWWLAQLWKRTVYMSSDEDHAIPCW